MGFDIYGSSIAKNTIQKDATSWVEKYKEVNINDTHDRSALNLLLPDDCLVVVGPPRIRLISDADTYSGLYPIGFLQGFSYSEQSQTQYLKTIGSRRHIPSRTNAPVQGSIQRLMFLGDNIDRIMNYSAYDDAPDELKENGTYKAGYALRNGQEPSNTGEDWWMTNFEEDLYRIPFGLGIIYNSPASLSYSKENGEGGRRGVYIECCLLTSKQTGFQAGSAYVAEQVSFIGDRVVGWAGGTESVASTSSL